MPEADIINAQQAWKKALESGNPDNVCNLYHKDAVLWGTLSPSIRPTPEKIKEYFMGFATRKGLKVVFNDAIIRIFNEIAVNSGSYTFSWIEGDEIISIPARYSFVYKNEKDKWHIVDHHSSKVPEGH